MNQIIDRLIEILCREDEKDVSEFNLDKISYEKKKNIFKKLCFERKPKTLDTEFLKLQNTFLASELKNKNITDAISLEYNNNMTIFFGDITELKVGAIVCASAEKLVCSLDPEDESISSDILSSGGLQIRQDIIADWRREKDQNKVEAKIIKGYNLPAKYIIYISSPKIVNNIVGYREKEKLIKCYNSCLDLALMRGLDSIAFCCISTGNKKYPKELASEIAVSTVKKWLINNNFPLKVVFCVSGNENKGYYETNFSDYDIW